MAVLAPLAVGALGAALAPSGYAAIAFTVGATLTQSLLQPDVRQVGPRLQDLTAQESTYGKPIPRLWGKMTTAGNVIWAQDIREDKTKETESGKGGPTTETVTFSYYGTFAVMLCEGPVDAITRIWLNSDLVYDITDSADADTIAASNKFAEKVAFYLGTTTQTVDPTIESYEGAGNAPAYRSRCYIVFDDINIDRYRTIPQITAEIVVGSTSVPTEAASWDRYGFGCSYDNGLITEVNWDTTSASSRVLLSSGGQSTRRVRKLTPSGTIVDEYSQTVNNHAASNNQQIITCLNDPRYEVQRYSGAGASPISGWFVDGVEVASPVYGPDGGERYSIGQNSAQYISFYRYGEHLYAISYVGSTTAGYVTRWPIVSGIPSTVPDAFFDLIANGYNNNDDKFLTINENGRIFCFCPTSTPNKAIEFDTDLNVIQEYTTIPTTSGAAYTAAMYQDLFFISNSGTQSTLWQLSGTTYSSLGTIATNSTGGANPEPVAGLMYVGDGLALAPDKLVNLKEVVTESTVALSTVVSEICQDAGLSAGQIDATDLAGINVAGYARTKPMPARSAIEPLQSAYWFDAAEFGGKINFVARGGASVDSVPEDDLAARGEGNEPDEAFVIPRADESELPRRVTVRYLDPAADNQLGTQYAARITTRAQAEEIIDLSVSLSAADAADVAEVLLYDAWQSRERPRFSLPAEDYYALNPTDVIDVTFGARTYTVRLTRIDFELPGILRCEGALEDSTAYTPVATGFTPTTLAESVALVGPSVGRVLDIPLLSDLDDPAGFYIAATGYTTGWPGCLFLMSTDGGASYQVITAINSADRSVMGRATSALATGETAVVDSVNSVTVDLYRSDDSLSTITDAQLLNLNNAALIGDEVLAFRDAVNTGGKSWTLDTFLRAQRGTDYGLSTHAVNEDFIRLEVGKLNRVALADDYIGSTIYYKFVTLGTLAADVGPSSFVYSGNAYEPYSVTHLTIADAGAGNWDLAWVRRTRVGGAWRDFVDASLSEDSEEYTVEVYNGATLSSTTTVTSPSATVAASSGNTVKVYQNSATTGPGFPAEVTVP